MNELENLLEMRYNDVKNFERFADLVRVTVVKLKAENRHAELGELKARCTIDWSRNCQHET